MRDMYESDRYVEQNPTWHEEDAPWKAAHIRRILRDGGVLPRSICEVGCGTGDILLELERAYPEAKLSGYEISPAAFRRAERKATERTKFYLADVCKREAPPFDVLLAIDVFEHVDDYMTFLAQLRDKATYKVFHIPLDLSVQSLARSWPIMNLRDRVGHMHYFYKESALAVLRDCGYTLISHRYTASRLELPGQAWTSRVMSVPRRLAFSVHQDLAVRILGGFSLLVLAR